MSRLEAVQSHSAFSRKELKKNIGCLVGQCSQVVCTSSKSPRDGQILAL